MANIKPNNQPNKQSHSDNLKGYVIVAVVVAVMVLAFLYAAGKIGNQGVTAQKFVNLQQGDSAFQGFRRAHAKGVCIQGEFVSNGSLADYSRAEVFQKGATAFMGRHSVAGSNPTAPDLKAPVRSLALSFAPNTPQQWRTAMNTPPVMAVATPEDFFQQLVALSPDPESGQRNPQKIRDFFTAHPESRAFNEWQAGYQSTGSFATERYHSINAFYLVNESGQRQAVRWTMVPQASSQNISSLDENNADALFDELKQRLAQQAIRFDLVFALAEAADDVDNATIPWPISRTQINAGTVVIRDWEPQVGGACDGINFDPLILPDGIEASKDPILRARSATYAESFHRRALEVLLEQNKSGDQE